MGKDASGRFSAKMRRVVIDTNIYVDWLNRGKREDVLFEREAVKYLSAVVMMELSAGSFSVRDQRLIRTVRTAFAKAGRILLPTVAVYEEAGDVLRRLQVSQRYTLSSAYGLVNDVLIALSARSIGATVITQNERDFVAIQAIRPFKLTVVS